jgi:hypothetical protein
VTTGRRLPFRQDRDGGRPAGNGHGQAWTITSPPARRAARSAQARDAAGNDRPPSERRPRPPPPRSRSPTGEPLLQIRLDAARSGDVRAARCRST